MSTKSFILSRTKIFTINRSQFNRKKMMLMK